jgi:2-haloacid dehalogenase/putative hydrolase of the HAD superfamily
MYRGVLLDFYGTVVHEDDVVLRELCATIVQSAPTGVTDAEVARRWSTGFFDGVRSSHGDTFRTQRAIERSVVAATCRDVGATCDPDALSDVLFDRWQQPPVFPDALTFLAGLDVPVVVVSNIDRCDIEAAIAHHGLPLGRVLTSEDVRSYKPRPELFRAGLAELGLPPAQVLHVGDSTSSDVAGANRLGLPVAWVNRSGRPRPDGCHPDHEARNLDELLPLLR